MTPFLKSGATILLTPDPSWDWVGWDGILTVSSYSKPLMLTGEEIVIESDVPLFTLLLPREYTAQGFSDIPGLISTAFFTDDKPTLSDKIKVNEFYPLLMTSTGKFTCNYELPSQKITAFSTIPDPMVVKTGTWKVQDTKQDVFIRNQGCVDSRVPDLSIRQKVNAALDQTNIPEATWHELGGKGGVAIALGAIVVGFGISQFTPVGWAADLLAVAALTGAFLSGIEIGGGLAHLADFSAKVISASNCADLGEAGKAFETGIAKVGVGTIGAALSLAGSGKIAGADSEESLIAGLSKDGIKHNPEEILAIAKDKNGKTIFLEKGNSNAGLQHIMERHGDDFENVGIAKDDIPKVVMDAVTKGNQVGTTGTSTPVYETIYNGSTKTIGVGVGNNGFIVRANPTSNYKPLP
jgi:hypothetical protein